MVAGGSLQSILEQGLVRRVAAGAGELPTPEKRTASTGILSIDEALPGGGLGLGLTHEWVWEAGLGGEWRPPLFLMAWMAARAAGAEGAKGDLVVLIGRRCWGSAWMLTRVG